MRIAEVHSEAQFADLRDSWERLLIECAAASIFITWEWLSAWWVAYGVPGELRILLAYDNLNHLRGIAALRWRLVRRFGRTYRTLVFAGDGSADSDYLDFVIASGQEAAVLDALRKHLARDIEAGVLLELNEVPESSPNLGILRDWTSAGDIVSVEADSPCAAVPLPEDWPAFLKQLSPRFRTKVRSVLRSLEGNEDFQFHFCRDQAEVDDCLPSLFELHRRRWAKESKPGVFGWDRKQAFYRTLSPLLFNQGRLVFSTLHWKGRLLACQYGFVFRQGYSQLQEGYDPDCEHLNLGIALRAWSVQELIQRGVTNYDFLGGISRHKSDWGARAKTSKRLVLGKKTATNTLFCHGPQWMVDLRQSAKRIAPKSWLASRDQWQEKSRVSAFEGVAASGSATHGWQRDVVASFYFHSSLPRVLRPWRDRYALRRTRRSALGYRLEKRTVPTVRILYYHHIGDEQDPFFPSTPTAIFEEEMRIISSNYLVVSLDEAVRRLTSGGPPDPMVVVTFDDGYLDNYQTAFPILQRHGLTATIFLTTGALDSGEALWFDKLSLAVKKSPHTYVDLDLDRPRRFQIRDLSEKLSCRDQLYAYFRAKPDSERREELRVVMSRLGGQDDGERDGKMLTWDQVRLLRSHGIAFGGHTVTHPFVSRLSPDVALWEAAECKRRIEQELQEEVQHFAYPSGRDIDFAPWNKQIVKELGYRSAVSTMWGINDPFTDPLELRRGQPWEAKGAVFAAKFDWYQWVNG